ncbi:MAG: FAD-dependent oxidoreductase [Thiobacillaceae bacterium]
MAPILIVGSGLAAYTLAKEFRQRDATTPLMLITADDGAFYSKPNLSNALSTGKTAAALAAASAEKMAADFNLKVLPNTRVTALDTGTQRVRLNNISADNDEVHYHKLILALGADPIAHGLSGDAANEVLAVNDLNDYARFRSVLGAQVVAGRRRVTVLGGGLIGCEFANDLTNAGYAVSVIHLGDWPLERLLPAEAGKRLADSFAALGVNWHFGRSAQRVHHANDGLHVMLDNGEVIATDVVLSAIGLRPRTQLAQAASIPVNRGIVVDRYLETGAANVFALGDCAEVDGANLPYVQPLMIQARALAATLAGEKTAVVYPPMPVMVKTPAHPVAVLPPKPGATGSWQMDCSDTGICALHRDASGRLQGFALTGTETSRRLALVKELVLV